MHYQFNQHDFDHLTCIEQRLLSRPRILINPKGFWYKRYFGINRSFNPNMCLSDSYIMFSLPSFRFKYVDILAIIEKKTNTTYRLSCSELCSLFVQLGKFYILRSILHLIHIVCVSFFRYFCDLASVVINTLSEPLPH